MFLACTSKDITCLVRTTTVAPRIRTQNHPFGGAHSGEYVLHFRTIDVVLLLISFSGDVIRQSPSVVWGGWALLSFWRGFDQFRRGFEPFRAVSRRPITRIRDGRCKQGLVMQLN
jgi:hypothetical protein